jgi:DNA-binding beta-propeller fold protein YncE
MRMKFNKSGQLLLVSAASLFVSGLMTACGTLTVDFVYVTSAKAAGTNNYGEVNVFEVNSESGRMKQIPTSPFPSGGRNPVAEAVSTDHNNLYVVNRDDNSIVQFVIGNDGKLYPTSTVNTPGVFPVAVTVQGTNLYVADTYQPLSTCSPAAPCAGSVASFPISTTGGLGSAASNVANSSNYWPLTLPSSPTDVILPTSITALASGNAVYVAAYDSTTNTGYIYGFSSASGVLTPMNGGVPVSAGTHPSAIIGDPSSSYVYVTDFSTASVLGFAVGSGTLTPLSGSPFPAGNEPSAITIDAAGKWVYVANSLDSTVTAYSLISGALTRNTTYAVGTQPVAIGIDPSLNEYLYTANFLGNTVTGFQLSATDGSLLNSQDSPYPSNAQPTAVAAIPHGSQKK